MPEFLPPVVDADRFTATPQPTLLGIDYLTLRPWTETDASVVYRAFQDPAIIRWHVRTAESVGQVRRWIERWRAAWSTGEGQWAVSVDDEVAGRIGLRGAGRHHDGCHDMHLHARLRTDRPGGR